jgi:hypothetical protein
MEELLSLIDKVIVEHAQIKERIQRSEQAISDLAGSTRLEDARESFVPGRLGGLEQGATGLERDLASIVDGLEQHFLREEEALLKAFERLGIAKLASLLHALLDEHGALRRQFADMRAHAAELATVQSSRNVWEPKAWAIRAETARLGRELEAHALREEALFQDVKKALHEEGG